MEHTGEQLQYTCSTCAKVICAQCVLTEHRPLDNHQLHKVDDTLDGALRQELARVLQVAQNKVDAVNSVTSNSTERMDALRTQVCTLKPTRHTTHKRTGGRCARVGASGIRRIS